LVTAPAAPAAIFASGSSKAISVRWLPSFGATGYDLLRSTTSGSGYTAIASNLPADKTSYVDATAVAGVTYYYVARAKNSVGTSGNSPQFYGSLLPPLTNLAFSGTASDDKISAASNTANGFDQNPGSLWFHQGTTGWLQYDFGAGNAQVVKRYTINCADVAARDPKSWNFRGSQDGVSWTTLNSQSNQSFVDRLRANTYNIGNTTAYRFYRLEITANNGDGSVTVAELGLWSDTGRTVPNGTYRVLNRKSLKAIGASGGAIANGTPFDQWDYFDSDNQKWTFADQGNGQYKITGVGSGRVMDVSGVSTANGAAINLWDWLNANNQKWTVIPVGNGSFKLTAVHSGKVADVSGGSTANGASIIQWGYLGATNQQWLISIAP
jgi:hypothetical protein